MLLFIFFLLLLAILFKITEPPLMWLIERLKDSVKISISFVWQKMPVKVASALEKLIAEKFTKVVPHHNIVGFLLSPEQLFNICIGLTVATLMHFIHVSPIKSVEDVSMDVVMELSQYELFGQKNLLIEKQLTSQERLPSFVVLDIDDETYKEELNNPPFTPRNYLTKIIEQTVSAGAKLLIVDIDLSSTTPLEGGDEKNSKKVDNRLHSHDQEIYNYLYNYKERNCSSGCPIIVLASPPAEEISEDVDRVSRMGFLEGAVKRSEPYVQWASMTFATSPHDGVQRWRVKRPPVFCDGTMPQVIPPVELLTAAWFRNGAPQEPEQLQNFQNALRSSLTQFKQDCNGKTNNGYAKTGEPLKIGKLVINNVDTVAQRVVYTMPWQAELPYYLPEGCESRNNNGCVLEIYPAKDYNQKNVLKSLDGKIVMIAGSHGHKVREGDIHLTPLGDMLGGVVIVNAIYSLLQFDMKSVDMVTKLIVEAIFIILMSSMIASPRFFNGVIWTCAGLSVYWLIWKILPTYMDHSMSWVVVIYMVVVITIGLVFIYMASASRFLMILFSGVACVFLTLPIVIEYFEENIWLDIATPLIVIQFHKIIDAVDKSIRNH